MNQNLENQSLSQDKETVILDKNGVKDLLITGKWTMFFSILGFIFIGLSFIVFLIMLAKGGQWFGAKRITLLPMLPGIILLAIYIFPIYYLFKFSDIVQQTLTSRSIYKLGDAISFLKKHFRFIGIVTIVILSLYLIIFISAFLMGSFMA